MLGLVENFGIMDNGIWNLGAEWKDVIAFVLLILFLAYWPKGLLPRK